VNQNQEPSPQHGWKKITFAYLEEWFSRKTLRRDRSEWAVILAVTCYTVIFSYFTIVRYAAFNAYAWDLGIFNQSFYTTLHSGMLFFSTIEQFICPSGIFFATHFSPILYIVLPFYAVTSSPQALLVFQTTILALGAIPLYFFAKHSLNNRAIAVVFSLSYLLYPLMQGVNWFDFHVQAFLPLFFFCTMYYLAEEKWPLYFFFVFLSLTVAENVPITVIFIGAYCVWRFRKRILQAIKARNLKEKTLIVSILTFGAAGFWTWFATWIRQVYFPFDPVFTQLYKAVDNWSVLGVQGDPSMIPFYVITRPLSAFNALTYDLPVKVLYVILLFGPLLFLSFRSSIAAISLAWLVPALFSNYPPYYMMGDHFPAYIVVFVFLAAVEAVKKGTDPSIAPSTSKWNLRLPAKLNKLNKLRFPPKWSLSTYAKTILVVSIGFAVVVSPLSPAMTAMEGTFPYFADCHIPVVTEHDHLLQIIADMVPDKASILTINSIFAHFSSRNNSYAYPLDSVVLRYNGPELQKYIEDLFQKSDYVMSDDKSDHFTTSLIAERVQKVNDFGLYAWRDGICLYMKNYTGVTLQP
jgi:uncharacterized membrane protein